MNRYRNPADLLGLDRDPHLHRLLRACGVEEARITGGASDYDKFLALAEAMPLCEGHSLQAKINETLQTETGLTASLCPHTARHFWEAWVEVQWYGRKQTFRDLPAVCPHCAFCEPTVVGDDDLTELPDPLAVYEAELSAWSHSLEEVFFSVTGKIVTFRLPEDYSFVRPNPYHAGEVIRKLFGREVPTFRERDLLLTQALRVWGQASLQIRWGGEFLLRGGHPEAVAALLAYLDASRALPPLIWIPDDPADAGAVSGLYVRVGTGVELFPCDSAEERERRISAYATVAPIGRAVVME